MIDGDKTTCNVCGEAFHKFGIGMHRKGCLRLKKDWLSEKEIKQSDKEWSTIVGTWGKRARSRFRRRQLNEYWLKYTFDLRKEVINKYGGKCCRCGIKDIRVLQIDHVFGDGKEERSLGGDTYTIYRKLRDTDVSKRYQILCLNCNWIKRLKEDKLIGGDERAYRKRKACRTARSAANPRRTS